MFCIIDNRGKTKMRAKELKNFLENIPDDTELYVRCKIHETQATGAKEAVKVVSVSPLIDNLQHTMVFNTLKETRLVAFDPLPTDMVSCSQCIHKKRITVCQQREKSCDDCVAVCACKDCGHTSIEAQEEFAKKPYFEKDKGDKK